MNQSTLPAAATLPLPLLRFFNSLRENEFPLGIDDYCALLPVMALGDGLAGYGALLRTCKLLWLKDHEQEPLFQRLFEQAWEQERIAIAEFKVYEAARRHKKKNTKPVETPKPDTGTDDTNNPISPSGGDEGARQSNPETPQASKPEETSQPEQGLVKISIESSDSQANLPLAAQNDAEARRAYVTSGSWLALKERDLIQRFRFLRHLESGGAQDTIDVQATVRLVAREGRLFEPVWERDRRNTARLLVFIDHEGSMAAFGELAETLARSAHLNREALKECYYFYNLPGEHVWTDKAHTRPVLLRRVLESLKRPHTRLLIISDAGAARGRYTPARVEASMQWLTGLPERRIAWINPLPAWRWKENSAASIAQCVPMFEASPQGLREAVRFLKGSSIKTSPA